MERSGKNSQKNGQKNCMKNDLKNVSMNGPKSGPKNDLHMYVCVHACTVPPRTHCMHKVHYIHASHVILYLVVAYR
jgi:hypothetical protein